MDLQPLLCVRIQTAKSTACKKTETCKSVDMSSDWHTQRAEANIPIH